MENLITASDARERSFNSLCFSMNDTDKGYWEELVSQINKSIAKASESGLRNTRFLIPISKTVRFKALIIMMLGINGYTVEISDAANVLTIRW